MGTTREELTDTDSKEAKSTAATHFVMAHKYSRQARPDQQLSKFELYQPNGDPVLSFNVEHAENKTPLSYPTGGQAKVKKAFALDDAKTPKYAMKVFKKNQFFDTASELHCAMLSAFCSRVLGRTGYAYRWHGKQYFLTDWLQGTRLDQTRAEFSKMSITQRLGYALTLLEQIDLLHENGIIIRDIKPQNIMFSGDRLQIFDFDAAFSIYDTSNLRLLYTPAFVDDQMLQDIGKTNTAKFDVKSDIYALGRTLMFLFPDFIQITDLKLIVPIGNQPDHFLIVDGYKYVFTDNFINTPLHSFLLKLIADHKERPSSIKEIYSKLTELYNAYAADAPKLKTTLRTNAALPESKTIAQQIEAEVDAFNQQVDKFNEKFKPEEEKQSCTTEEVISALKNKKYKLLAMFGDETLAIIQLDLTELNHVMRQIAYKSETATQTFEDFVAANWHFRLLEHLLKFKLATADFTYILLRLRDRNPYQEFFNNSFFARRFIHQHLKPLIAKQAEQKEFNTFIESSFSDDEKLHGLMLVPYNFKTGEALSNNKLIEYIGRILNSTQDRFIKYSAISVLLKFNLTHEQVRTVLETFTTLNSKPLWYYSIHMHDMEVLKFLIDRGANPLTDKTPDGGSMLSNAIQTGIPKIIAFVSEVTEKFIEAQIKAIKEKEKQAEEARIRAILEAKQAEAQRIKTIIDTRITEVETTSINANYFAFNLQDTPAIVASLCTLPSAKLKLFLTTNAPNHLAKKQTTFFKALLQECLNQLKHRDRNIAFIFRAVLHELTVSSTERWTTLNELFGKLIMIYLSPDSDKTQLNALRLCLIDQYCLIRQSNDGTNSKLGHELNFLLSTQFNLHLPEKLKMAVRTNHYDESKFDYQSACVTLRSALKHVGIHVSVTHKSQHDLADAKSENNTDFAAEFNDLIDQATETLKQLRTSNTIRVSLFDKTKAARNDANIKFLIQTLREFHVLIPETFSSKSFKIEHVNLLERGYLNTMKSISTNSCCAL